MPKLNRRSFITGASTIPFALWLKGCGGGTGDGGGGGGGGQDPGDEPQPGGPLVRYDARSSEGQAMLQIYDQAVGQMQDAIAEGDPTSWVFQWYIHGVKGPSNTPDQNKAGEIARIYPSPSPHKALAEEIWSTCQAHYAGDDENFFLPWHRMYVYFFERIIREVSGEASFTLPYWNYSTADAAIRGVIPPEFRDFGSSLFIPKRNPGVNDGQPIQQGQPGDPLSLVSLSECTYKPDGARQGFNMRLDFGLHGNVHVLTGNGQNMGAVPWAAGDPIFWAHHCNIDRLWASWNAGGRQNPTDPTWLDQTFVFADADGQRVEAQVSDFTAIAPLGYSYQSLEPVPSCPEAQPGLAATVVSRHAATASPVALTSEPVRVSLGALPESRGIAAPLAAEDRRLYLLVKGLASEIQPETLYHLYLGLPDAADPKTNEPHLCGSINFFGAGHGGHGGDVEEPTERFLSFDVTDLARKLQAEGTLGSDPALTIAPASAPAEAAKPVLGEITLVEQ